MTIEIAKSDNSFYIKRLIKAILPNKCITWIRNRKINQDFKKNIRLFDNYPNIEKRISSKSVINIAFFVVEPSMWKYDELFKLFLHDKSYNPKIIICPYLNYKGTQTNRIINEAITFFKSKKYPYISTFNERNNSFIELKDIFNPDIIFYCFPYLQATREDLYGIQNFPNSLFCYVPYSSMICNTNMQFNKTIQNFSWAFFVENSLVKDLVCKYSPTKGINTISSGFPSLDIYRKESYVPKKIWKHGQKIKIIWAPHYTILDGIVGISFSTFLQYCDEMIELSKKYSDIIQIAFKPHPFLYPTLCSYWGNKKTDEYYDLWRNMNNTQYVTGEYVDLFMTSDAMIFDSVSFIVEYLYTKKPSLFTYKEGVENQLNEYGLKAFECHQKAKDIKDVERFIVKLIEGNIDSIDVKKENFYNDYLSLPNYKTASDNIYNYINNKLKKQ